MSETAELVAAEATPERRRGRRQYPPRTTPRWRRWLLWLNVAGLLAVSIWFRGRDLGNIPGINGDEAWYGVQAQNWLHGGQVNWRTPTGNLLNPLFFWPQVLLHHFFEPSFALLRVTAVASGLLALALNYWLARRILGRRMAIVSTLILAVLPVNIAYSRLAWDSCQSLLATLPAVYFALWAIADPPRRSRRTMVSLAALAVAIIVHPTNIFIGPMVAACLGYAWWPEIRRSAVARFAASHCMAAWISTAAFIGVALAGLNWFAESRLHAAVGRLVDPSQFTAFAANFNRFFSGATTFQYISGAMSAGATSEPSWELTAYDLATAAAFGILGWALWRRFSDRRRPAEVYLAIGWGLSLAAFFAVAGPAAIAPHFERYALWLVAPTTLLATLAIGWWLEQPGRAKSIAAAMGIGICWMALFGFQANYFGFFQQTGGQSHPTFRTAALEPKQAAYEYVVKQSADSLEQPQIVASEWWNYWPLAYLNGPPTKSCRARVDTATVGQDWIKEFRERAPYQSVWWIEFTDSHALELIRQYTRDAGLHCEEAVIPDFSGRAVLSVFQLPAAKKN